MASALSDHGMRARPGASNVPVSMKIVVAGGFAVGKTTFIGSISEIEPLCTEAEMTVESLGVDTPGPVAGKLGTTVAMDFGRITIGPDMVLYLFGTPGQDRFWFLWDELVKGAVGGVVLVDTRRVQECFAAVDYFEATGLPFVVAVNLFDGVATHHPREVREALSVPANVPVVLCDARRTSHVQETLVLLVESALRRAQGLVASRSARPPAGRDPARRSDPMQSVSRPAGASRVLWGSIVGARRENAGARRAVPEQLRNEAVARPTGSLDPMRARQTFWVETLGCPKNAVDSDKVTASLLADGLAPAADAGVADLVVVNTCAFVEDARRESVDVALALSDARKAGARLVVTGCMAERYGAELAAALPEADAVVGFAGEGALAAAAGIPVRLMGGRRPTGVRDLLELPEPGPRRPGPT